MPYQSLCRVATLLLAVTALSACASMSRDECAMVDWRTVGYEDGAAGQGAERLTSRRKACAKHGVAPDLDAYRMGREEGLVEYCQPANGFRVGASGTGYGGACPDYLSLEFSDAYQAGRRLWVLESQLNDTDRGIGYRRAEITRIDESMAANGFILMGETTTPEERAKALLDVKTLAERRGRLKAEMESLQRERPNQQAELDNYRAELAYNY